MRYGKQILLKEIGKKGQEKLNNSTVAIIGLGAIGSNSASLLARSGLNLILIDRDVVELENLQRQNLFSENDVGKEKALAAYETLKKINSEIGIEYFVLDLDYKNTRILENADIILDCTDNLESRFLINDFCVKNKKPWIYAGILGSKGMMLSFNNDYCFNCIFKEPNQNLETCSITGVFNTVASLIASLQVTEAIKILNKNEKTMQLLNVDIWNNKIDKIKVSKNKKCKTCNGHFDYLNGKKGSKVVKMCGKNSYQISGKAVNIDEIGNYLYRSKYSVTTKEFIAFKDGRVIIMADSENKAKILYDQYFG